MLSLFSFRYCPSQSTELDKLNLLLLERLNNDGAIYLTQTLHEGALVIRFVAGHFDMQKEDIDLAFEAIVKTARAL